MEQTIKFKKSNMNIGIDLDDCISTFLENFCIFHNAEYKTNHKLEDFWTYHICKVLKETVKESSDKVAEFYNSDFFNNIQPWEDSQKAISQLSKNPNTNLHILTSRFGAFGQTIAWLNIYFPGIFPEQNVFFTANIYAKREIPLTKAELCTVLDLDFLVEDSIDYIEQCCDVTQCILLDRPWNQKQTPQRTIRVYSWKDVPKYIK